VASDVFRRLHNHLFVGALGAFLEVITWRVEYGNLPGFSSKSRPHSPTDGLNTNAMFLDASMDDAFACDNLLLTERLYSPEFLPTYPAFHVSNGTGVM
jgi:hypothetical protein